jgi:hypothetical protein
MNRGLDLEKEQEDRQDEDWVFGAASQQCLAVVPPADREAHLPPGEVQRGRDDLMDCASRAPLNVLETKFNYLLKTGKLPHAIWLRDNGYITEKGFEFSDAFIAILSGTRRTGNSLKAPCHAIHEYGLIPKQKLPLRKDMTWEEYHNKERVTGSLMALGEQFKSRFTINYERVLEADYDTLLEDDMLIVAGYAWPKPKGGEYPRTDNKPNHAIMAIRTPKYFIFDNYETRDSYIKKLANDYDLLDYGYRLYISTTPASKDGTILSLMKQTVHFLTELLSLKRLGASATDHFSLQIGKLTQLLAQLRQTNRVKLYDTARRHIGIDVTPLDKINDDVACAETVTTLLRIVLPDTPIIPGTASLHAYFNKNWNRYELVSSPKTGDIVLSPTIGKNVGHVGIVGLNNTIMSNDSRTGLFVENYTVSSWIERFVTRKGLKVYWYRLK